MAPSDPNIVYVGSGEGLHRPDLSVGDGIYKSTDAGATWTHLGLRDGQQISQMAVDPRDPNRLFVAVAGHPYGPNPERGIYRSTDGGQSFEKVLYKDENIGGSDVQIDPSDSNVVYATLWEAREGPWENGGWNGGGGGHLQVDRRRHRPGSNWREACPAASCKPTCRFRAAIPKLLFAVVATKGNVELYRSDDGGESWTTVTSDPRPKVRIGGGGDLPIPADRSQESGRAVRRQHRYLEVDRRRQDVDGISRRTRRRRLPEHLDQSQRLQDHHPHQRPGRHRHRERRAELEFVVQPADGAALSRERRQCVSLSACAAGSRRAARCAFPAAAMTARSPSATGIRWPRKSTATSFPTRSIPTSSTAASCSRYDRRTAQAQNIMPVPLRSGDFRVIRTEPIVFSPLDPHLMYFAANTLWATRDGGHSWKQISPDLTRKTFEVPATVGIFSSEPSAQPRQRGVIYAVAPSPLDSNRIWAGTDDGLIWLTTDGGTNWKNVTPPQLSPWQKVSVLEASHTDPQTAYAAINTLRLDDLRPHIYRTHDGGETWTEIVSGIPADENVNSVREDPKRNGLLFAGTEGAVYVSFDDGDHWQSLRLNMPATSVRDLLIKDDDLAVATHGRGFWILDDITPLRQMWDVAGKRAYLFAPELAYRVRWNTNSDTPLPPDEPAGQNPPDGAIFNYYLKASASAPVTLEVVDSSGKVVRSFSSADPVPPLDPELSIPAYWLRPPETLSSAAGFHRLVWDMHYPPVAGMKPEYPICGGVQEHRACSYVAVDHAGEVHRGADGGWAEVYAAAGRGDGSAGEDFDCRTCSSSSSFRTRSTKTCRRCRRWPRRWRRFARK